MDAGFIPITTDKTFTAEDAESAEDLEAKTALVTESIEAYEAQITEVIFAFFGSQDLTQQRRVFPA